MRGPAISTNLPALLACFRLKWKAGPGQEAYASVGLPHQSRDTRYMSAEVKALNTSAGTLPEIAFVRTGIN